MKKYVALSVLILTSVGVVFNHVGLERVDNSYLLNVDGLRWDTVGALREKINSWTRQCDRVTRLTDESAMPPLLLAALREHSPPDSRQMKIRQLYAMAPWYVAEASFETLEPAVIVLRQSQNQFQIQDDALWSGSVGPWLPGPWIRRYLQNRAPDAPSDLGACYDPTPGLFRPQ